MKPKTQKDAVLKHLQKKGSITDLQAFKLYGIRRLSSIIHRLRRPGQVIDGLYYHWGLGIKTEKVPFKSSFGFKSEYAKYILKK